MDIEFPKDEISIEGITWTYQGPLGRPYGPDYESAESGFPRDIKAIGGGVYDPFKCF